MANITIFKDLFKSTDVPYIMDISKALERIKTGTSKEIVDKIRSAKTKEQRDIFKKKLPAILFSGEFSARNKQSCKHHSGFMILDFDKFPNDEEKKRIENELKNNQHVYSYFTSPSGDGVKALIKIPKCNAKDHERYFKEFHKEFKIDYFDEATCDISRVCFESYDPKIYINTNAVIFEPELIDEGFHVRDYVSYTPLQDEQKIIDRIMLWNWKKQFSEGQRNDYIFALSGVFCEFGISKETAIGFISNNIATYDESFTETELRRTVKNIYSKRQFHSRFFEDYEKRAKLKRDISKKKKEDILKEYDIDVDAYEEIKESVDDECFWYFEVNNKGEEKTKIDPLRFKIFLERNGFKKIFHQGSLKPIWVKIKSNKVEETSPEKIKDFVLEYLLNNKQHKVWSYCANYQTLFSDKFLLMLETVELMMLKDDRKTSYIAFNNGILTVTKNEINLIDYLDVDGYIWESQIIKRDFIKKSEFENDYKNFILNISNQMPEPIESVIGYLLSTYKNKMNNKAIILNDEVISDNPEGGTGKGLFAQGVRQIRNMSVLDGKTFDDKKSFPYQTVSKETQILFFDDVKKNWDFESKFSLVTEGITLERKNKDAIKLTVEESPKMLISTNYAIKGEGNSHDRRRHEIEISQFYGRNFNPYDDFGREMFDDWDIEDWVNFDNYMVFCLQLYLNKGLIKQEAKNIKKRKFIAETAMEFCEWVQDNDNFPLNIRNEKTQMFANFTQEYPDFNKFLSRKRFAIWIQKYANYIGADYSSGNTNGQKWHLITTDKNIVEPESDGIEF